MSYNNYKLAVILPCFRSKNHVLNVLKKIPDIVDRIYCVDDACTEETGKFIAEKCQDERINVIFHESNQGVGGAVITGYKHALKGGADILIKIDSDGQMDPTLIETFVDPIVREQADYTKGNRFFTPEFLSSMPAVRLFGNAGLSFLNKFSTGYWHIFDPTNGYTAIQANILRLLPLDKINKRYFFESDMLFRLGTIRAVAMDIPQKAIYNDEKSSLKISQALFTFFGSHIRNFFKRIIYSYFVRDFHAASVEWILGPALLIFSLAFGTSTWIESIQSGQEATAGTVMLAALPFIVGLQLTLSALHFDIQNQPRTPLHPLIRKISNMHKDTSDAAVQ